ncbi:MAG: cupin domain-containing protein [Verrucomicrobiota bacterium]
MQQALIQVLSGSCEVTLGGAPRALGSGDLVWMPPGLLHAVKATERFSMLLTLARPGGPMLPPLQPSAGRIPLTA